MTRAHLGTRRQEPPGLLHAHHPWRPEPRPADRRGDGADLRHLDLRPAVARRAQGVRICPQPEPDALCLRALPWPTSKAARPAFAFASGLAAIVDGAGTARYRRPYRRHRRHLWRLLPADGAGAQALGRSAGQLRRLHRPCRGRGGDPAGDEDCSGSRRRPIRCCASSTSKASPRWPSARACSRSPTTPSAAPISSGRWSSASTSSSIRRPNISTAIPTWSAACAVVGDNKDLADQLKFLQNAIGAISGPFDSFLALRGLKTLALRMERHSRERAEDRAAGWKRRKDVRRVHLSRPRQPPAACHRRRSRCMPSAA